jgi:LuxR family maltose regulon positive regulatory protein
MARLPQVAEKLFISLNTVKTHVSSIYRKLGVSTRQELFLRYLDVGERTGAQPQGNAAP